MHVARVCAPACACSSPFARLVGSPVAQTITNPHPASPRLVGAQLDGLSQALLEVLELEAQPTGLRPAERSGTDRDMHLCRALVR